MAEFLDAFELRTNGGSISSALGYTTYEQLLSDWKGEDTQHKKMVNSDYLHLAVGVNLYHRAIVVFYARLNA